MAAKRKEAETPLEQSRTAGKRPRLNDAHFVSDNEDSDAAAAIQEPKQHLLFLGMAPETDDTIMAVYYGTEERCRKVLAIIRDLIPRLATHHFREHDLVALFKALCTCALLDGDYFKLNLLTLTAYFDILKITNKDDWNYHNGMDIIDDEWSNVYYLQTFNATKKH